MIIHRVPPFPLYYTKTLEANTAYTWSLIDEYSSEVDGGNVTTTNVGTLSIEVPNQYDSDYIMQISKDGNLQVSEHISIVRPYIDIKDLLPATYTDEQYKKAVDNEVVARAVIDGYTNGFYLTKEIFETEGSGSDYLTIPYRLNRLFKVYESGDLVFDSEQETNVYNLGISADRTSIIHLGESDYESGRQIVVPAAGSDYVSGYGRRGSFPDGKDYLVEFETGSTFVPGVVSQCVKLLANDITCGSSYTNKYVLEYATDQYRIKYSARALNGTGNKTVDDLLKQFRDYTVRAGLI